MPSPDEGAGGGPPVLPLRPPPTPLRMAIFSSRLFSAAGDKRVSRIRAFAVPPSRTPPALIEPRVPLCLRNAMS